MPQEIVIVRHAQCTGNAADRASKKGDHSFYTPTLRSQKSFDWPLTSLGVEQSKSAGNKLRTSIAAEFDCYLCADIPRAEQTAQHLGFPDAKWERCTLLRERDWGGIECLPYPERSTLFSQAKISPEEDSLDWRPPGGQSMRYILGNMKLFLKYISAHYKARRIIAVTHGAPVQAMRVLQHAIPEEHYTSFISSDNYIRNCHIFHYHKKTMEENGIPMYRIERSIHQDPNGQWIERSIELR